MEVHDMLGQGALLIDASVACFPLESNLECFFQEGVDLVSGNITPTNPHTPHPVVGLSLVVELDFEFGVPHPHRNLF